MIWKCFKDSTTHFCAVQKSYLWSREFVVWQVDSRGKSLKGKHISLLAWDRIKKLEGVTEYMG